MSRTPRLLAFIALIALIFSAQAQDKFPSKPLKIVVPYSAGGGFDMYGRALAAALGKVFGQTVIVDNRPGANEAIGATYVKGQAPDGYTLLLASESGLINNPILVSNLSYDTGRDFAPVTRLIEGQTVYVVRKDIGVNSIKDFLEYAKRMDGKASYGSSGQGGTGHLAMAWLGASSKVQLIHAPYKGLGPALQDLLAGQIDIMVAPLPLVESHLAAGRLKAIAVTGQKRLPRLPDVPTVYETGDGRLDLSFYLGLVAPVGTPPDVVAKIASAVRETACSPSFMDANSTPYGYVSICDAPEAFKAFLREDESVRRDRIKAANVKLD